MRYGLDYTRPYVAFYLGVSSTNITEQIAMLKPNSLVPDFQLLCLRNSYYLQE